MKNNPFEMLDIVRLIKSHIKSYCIILSIVFILASTALLLTPNYYTSSVTLVPESAGGIAIGGNLASLASLAGVNISSLGGASDDAINSDIYPEVISSTPFLEQLLDINVETKKGDFKGSLDKYLKMRERKIWFFNFFETKDKDSIKSVAYISPEKMELFKKLTNDISVKVDRKTGLITISSSFEDAYVAQIVTDSVSKMLQKYIFNYRTKKETVDLQYAQEFMEKSRNDYIKASNDFSNYADIRNNLKLQKYKVQATFLENEMQTMYTIYNQAVQQVVLSQAKLQAKIPVYNVVQPAMIPTRKTGPKRTIIVIMVLFISAIGLTGFYFIKEKIANLKDCAN